MAITLSEKMTGCSRGELCEFASMLCARIEQEAGLEYRGGIFPDNVTFCEDGTIALGPAGEGTLRGSELLYVAPELYWNGKKTPEGDVYAVGLLMFFLSEGRLPFENDGCNDRKAQQQRMQGNTFPPPVACGRRLSEIIMKALSFNAGDRYKNVSEMKIMLDNCMKNLFLNSNPCAETVFSKNDDDLSEIERMMVSIIESHDDLAEETPVSDAKPEQEELSAAEQSALPGLEEPEPAPEEQPVGLPDELPEEIPLPEPVDLPAEDVPGEEELLPEPEPVPEELFPLEEQQISEEDVYVSPAEPEVQSEPETVPFEPVPELEPVNVTRRDDIDFPDILVNTDGTLLQPRKKPSRAEMRRRRRRPLIIILLLCFILIIAALVFNSMSEPPVEPELPEETAPSGIELEQPPEESEPPVEEPVPTVPVKMVSTYEFFAGNISWNEAKERCEQMGGHLVVIESSEELIRVTALAEQNNVGYVWIGLHRIGDELVWEKENETGEYYYRWAEGEPSVYDGDTPEDYVLLSLQDGNWFYNDCIADPSPIYGWYWNNLGYVCEIEKPEE